MPRDEQKQTLKETIARELALALMGERSLLPDAISDGATWQKGASTLIGREAILEGAEPATATVTIDEIVTHGKAAAVSGNLRDQSGQTRLFCHMIRFTNASANQVASIVSFEHTIKVK